MALRQGDNPALSGAVQPGSGPPHRRRYPELWRRAWWPRFVSEETRAALAERAKRAGLGRKNK